MEEYHQITLTEWQSWREEIRQKLQEAAGNFVYIGYRLKQIRDSGMYDGKSDFFEWAEGEYGLSKSTVSRFIAINEKFADPDNRLELKKEYQALGSSKLSEMLTLPDKECELITEQTTVKEIRELKSMDKDAGECPPQEEEGHTPLQECIIDYFKDKLDLLEKISGMLDEKDVAEAMAPSGYATHKKGLVFLFMYDYPTGVKYKLVGETGPIKLTWEEFYNEIHKIFFDYPGEYKDYLYKVYPKLAPKEENGIENPSEAENTEVKEAPKETPAEQTQEIPMPEPIVVADQDEDGTTKPVATSQQNQFESAARNSFNNLKISMENKAWKAALADAENVAHYLKVIIQIEEETNEKE